MTEPSQRSTEAALGGSRDPLLRRKYLDYCSARVAEVLVSMSPDEMYVLAQEVAAEAGARIGEPPSFSMIVGLATERLSRELSLPPFDDWAVAYAEDPEAFERQMLGLWEEDVGTTNSTAY